MEESSRITYSPEEYIQSMESALDRLGVFRYDSHYRALFGENFIERLCWWEQNIRKRKEDPFTVVVVGDFKRGKSSFINALLGEDVATTDVTTETVTLNRISYGEHSNKAILSGGRRISLTDEELKKESLEGVIRKIGEPVRQVELKRPIELLKDITIIDTPGMGDAMKDFSNLAEEALQQADAVIYVYSVRYPLSQQEQLFIKAGILPQKYTKLYLLGNYADTFNSQKELCRMQEFLDTRVEDLLEGQKTILISALDERCRQLGTARPAPASSALLESHFEQLRSDLKDMIEDKREATIPDRMQRLVKNMVRDLNESLNMIEQGLTMDLAAIKKADDAMREEQEKQVETRDQLVNRVEEACRNMSGEAVVWMRWFLEQLRRESSHLDGISAEDLLKHYSFYCTDLLQEAVNTCLDYHRSSLFDLLDHISKELVPILAEYTGGGESYSFRFELDNKAWTKGDSVGMAVSLFSSYTLLGTVVSMVTDGIAGNMRQREIGDRAPEIIRKIAAQFPELEASVNVSVREAYQKMEDSAKKKILEYYDEKLAQAERSMEQASSVARKEDAEKQEICRAVKQLREVLTSLEKTGGWGRE